jgi:hypothetical protein
MRIGAVLFLEGTSRITTPSMLKRICALGSWRFDAPWKITTSVTVNF